jgi:uncharacterized protein (DUF1778 family)
MMPQEPTRTARIEARIAPEALAVVKRAAEIQAQRQRLCCCRRPGGRAPHDRGSQIIRLSVEDQRAFAEAMLNPPPLTPAMERAIERCRRHVTAAVD